MKNMNIDGDIALTENEVFYKNFWNREFFKIGKYDFDGKYLVFEPNRNKRFNGIEKYTIPATSPWDVEYLTHGDEELCVWQFDAYYVVGDEADTLNFYRYDDEHFASLTEADQYRYLCNQLTAGADPLADLWDGIIYDGEAEDENVEMNYTNLELKVIKTIGNFLNYDDLETNLNDNATYFMMDDIGIVPKKLRGVLSSLEQKGLIYKNDELVEEPVFMVTDFGIKEYHRIYGDIA